MSGTAVAKLCRSILEVPVKRTLVAGAIVAIVAGACGGGSDDTADAEAASTTPTRPTTTTTGEAEDAAAAPAIVPGEDADVDAVVEAYMVVFDSSTTMAEKTPYLVDPEGLEDTVTKYTTNGELMGGVSLDPKSVIVNGDTAVVYYDFLFGGNPSYTDLTGDAVKTEEGWQITREMFCGIMTSARAGCPPG
jgi:hypothetical protein